MSANSHSIIHAKGKRRADFYVEPSFERAVLVHFAKNAIDIADPPLLLGVQGPRGEGKSESIKEICSKAGITIFHLAGAMLSGVHEAEPVLKLQEAYVEATLYRKVSGGLSLLLIDDIDTSVAAVDSERRYTVNSQLLSGGLMALADNPKQIGDKTTDRVPIVMTGNNFTLLYNALTRHGRMKIFNWKPTVEIKIEIASAIFRDCMSPNDLCLLADLVREHAVEPVAFWRELKSEIYDELLFEGIRAKTYIDLPYLRSLCVNRHLQVSFDRLGRAAKDKTFARPEDYSV